MREERAAKVKDALIPFSEQGRKLYVPLLAFQKALGTFKNVNRGNFFPSLGNKLSSFGNIFSSLGNKLPSFGNIFFSLGNLILRNAFEKTRNTFCYFKKYF